MILNLAVIKIVTAGNDGSGFAVHVLKNISTSNQQKSSIGLFSDIEDLIVRRRCRLR